MRELQEKETLSLIVARCVTNCGAGVIYSDILHDSFQLQVRLQKMY